MNLSHKTYSELMQDAQIVRDAIAAKQNERQMLTADIGQLREKIDNLDQALASEERAMTRMSKLKQPTMSAVDFITKRKELESMRGDLPTLHEAVAFLDRSLEALQGELRIIHDWMSRKIEQYSIDLVPQLASRLIESSSTEFKDLVTAVIAANGGHLNIGSTVCDAVFKALSDAEGFQLPDFGQARNFVAERLDTAVAEAV